MVAGIGYIKETIKAMRIERSFIAIFAILIPVAFADKITNDIYLLSCLCVIAYAIGSLYNAKVDGDYNVRYTKQIIFALFVTGTALSFNNIILMLTFISWFILGFIYSRYLRFMLFGDSTLLALTHAAIPILSSSLLLGLDIRLTISLAAFMFLNLWLAIPIKNINNSDKDKELGYNTLITRSMNGKAITHILFESYLISMFFAYFIFDLGNKFLFVLCIIFILRIFVFNYINNGNEAFGYKLSKMATLLFSLGIIISKTTDYRIISIPLLLILLYAVYLGFAVMKDYSLELKRDLARVGGRLSKNEENIVC